MKEASKAVVRRLADVRYATRFFVGAGIDIGAGSDPVSLYAEQFPLMTRLRVWDMPDGDAEKLATIQDESLDFVHSSHCLEHMADPMAALTRWFGVIKPGGHMVLLFPDEDLYEQGIWPSNKNHDHKWTFAIYKKKSWSPKSLNVLELIAKLPAAAELLKIEKLDASYRYNLPPLDQTLTPIGECAIEMVIRKRLPAEIAAGGRLPPQGQLSREQIFALTGLNLAPAPAPVPAPPNIGEMLALAVERQNARDDAAAEKLYRAVLAREPDNFDATHLLGVLFRQRGDADAAVAQIRKALQLVPRSNSAYGNLGNALRDAKRFDEALACYESAIALVPQNAESHFQRGNILRDQGLHEASLAAYNDALRLQPAHAEALNGRGNAYYALEKLPEARTAYEAALALKPDFADALSNCAVVLRLQGQHDQALALYDRAIAARPDFGEAYVNRGVALCDLGRYEEALAGYKHVLARKPDDPLARMNGAMLDLLLGNLEQGWPGYEFRWQAGNFPKPDLGVPQWRGEGDLAGKRILLHAEQGLGDTIQFVRYAPMIAARGARVVLQVQPALKPLLETLAGVESVLTDGDKLPTIDLHCPLLSLPLAFATTLTSIPGETPYLKSDPKRAAKWLKKLGPTQKKRIGLVWSGNPIHKNDRNRSIGLAALAPLFAIDADFVSLQKEIRTEDRLVLANLPNFRHFGDALNDFSDTAALVAAMDLVVGVDTSVLHLAGALGKRTFALLPQNPDWRWLLARTDSPWYPSFRLFRQDKRGVWDSVLGELVKNLNESA
jgi:tetratricopeptide (TPR) repeat protein